MNIIVSIGIIVTVLFFALKGEAMQSLKPQNIGTGPNGWPGDESDPVWRVCHAIATAEGYGQPNVAPTNLNNPGDLSPGDENGQATIGDPEQHDGSFIIHFASAMGGWTALYIKINRIKANASKIYSPDMTWQQFANEYAGDSVDWVNNVTSYLGTTTDARVGDSLGV